MVHQYKLNGYNIVLDSCSGSIHSVDEVAYVRFASVYRKFKDVEEFIEAIRTLEDGK